MRAPTMFVTATLLLGAAISIPGTACAEDPIDTVFLTNGGRVRGAIMVDDAKVVSVKLADGKTKEIARGEVMRVEYAATAAATTETAATKPKARPKPEPEEEEAEAPPPTKKKRRHYDTMDDADSSPEQKQEDEASRQRRLTGARRMIGAGATLTAIGWAAVLGGLVAVGVGAANGDEGPVLGGALVTGFSLPLAITGSVLLSVGVRQKRKAALAAFVTDDATEWDTAFQLDHSLPQPPPLVLTVAF